MEKRLNMSHKKAQNRELQKTKIKNQKLNQRKRKNQYQTDIKIITKNM